MTVRSACCFPILFVVMACGDGKGEGTLAVTAYGESFIEDGIPAEDVNDGWAIVFDKFIVSVEDVHVAGRAIDVDAKIDVSRSSKGKGHEIGGAAVEEGSYTHGAYSITKVDLKGSATKGDEIKTFEWVFDDATRYSECETTTTVPNEGTATFQITVHADHLFYDSLVSEEPEVLFQAFADADANNDGNITKDELSATDIGGYDPGSEGGTDDLWSWLTALTRTLGHVDGEGHCHAEPVK